MANEMVWGVKVQIARDWWWLSTDVEGSPCLLRGESGLRDAHATRDEAVRAAQRAGLPLAGVCEYPLWESAGQDGIDLEGLTRPAPEGWDRL